MKIIGYIMVDLDGNAVGEQLISDTVEEAEVGATLALERYGFRRNDLTLLGVVEVDQGT